jgi:hypothetical protein
MASLESVARRRWIWLAAAAGIVAGTAAACADQPVETAPSTATLAQITCGADGAHVQSPVMARPDGVHLVVTGPDDATVVVAGDPPVALGLQPGEFGPMVLYTRSGSIVSELGPGTYEIGCRDGTSNAVLPVTAPLFIVDPDGLWVDDRVTCLDRSIGNVDYVEGAEGSHGDLVTAFRQHLTGLLPGDVVTTAGYPATPARKVRVVRQGDVVAVGTYEQREPGNWLLSDVEKCDHAGLGG